MESSFTDLSGTLNPPDGSLAVAGAGSVWEILSDYLSLTKPKIISLLLISTCCPMILASGGALAPMIMVWTLIGGTLVTGSASAMNCIWDRDIDRLMKRTQERPMAARRISLPGAWLFSFVLLIAGFWIFYYFVNPVSAWAALGGHLFYVLIYTMWLKRTTPQNIVIGGAAGAVPPLVGWAAATGEIGTTAILIFLIVFLWTPPHFWALALNKNDDYRRAGVPMLPVVKGEAETYSQMLVYSLLLIPASVLLVMAEERLGHFSMSALVLLSVLFALSCWDLKRSATFSEVHKSKKAWGVFGFSLVYLALFFVVLVIDGIFF